MTAKRNTSNKSAISFILAVILLAIMFTTLAVQLNRFPIVDAAPARINMPARIDRECSSPKLLMGRIQDVLLTMSNGAQKGFRMAACGTGATLPEQAPIALPVVPVTPVVEQAPVCVPLFVSADAPPAFGGVVTESKGNWEVVVRDGVHVVEKGRFFTVTFDTNVVIAQVAVFDNDPKVGEAGATLNGVELPITDSNGWATLYPNTVTNVITFAKGDDSAHIGICILGE